MLELPDVKGFLAKFFGAVFSGTSEIAPVFFLLNGQHRYEILYKL